MNCDKNIHVKLAKKMQRNQGIIKEYLSTKAMALPPNYLLLSRSFNLQEYAILQYVSKNIRNIYHLSIF